MTKISELPLFDPVKYLQSDEDIAHYLTAMAEGGKSEHLIAALGDIAKAQGMTEIARKTGLSRESLYKALSENGNPQFDTIYRVLKALGVGLAVTPRKETHAQETSA